jgi:hypothetical protein
MLRRERRAQSRSSSRWRQIEPCQPSKDTIHWFVERFEIVVRCTCWIREGGGWVSEGEGKHGRGNNGPFTRLRVWVPGERRERMVWNVWASRTGTIWGLGFLAKRSAQRREGKGEKEGRKGKERHLICCSMYGENVYILREGMLEVIIVPFCERTELIIPGGQLGFGAPSHREEPRTPSQVTRLTNSFPATLTFQSTIAFLSYPSSLVQRAAYRLSPRIRVISYRPERFTKSGMWG